MSRNVLKKNRATVLIVIGALFFVVIIAKLYQVQIMSGEAYVIKADRQYSGGQSDVFDRGSIYFTDKDGKKIAAATVKTGYKVAINPSSLENPEDIFNILVNLLNLDEEVYAGKALKKGDPYEEIAKRVDPDLAESIIEKDLDGVSFYKERWRFYPGKNLAAQTIGFLSYAGDELKAQYGLERYYDDVLNRDNEGAFKNFFVEIFSGLGEALVDKKQPKGSIVTTIEPSVQSFVAETLAEVEATWHSKFSGAIVMNPKTGEIYAMAVHPTFDLNEFSKVDDSAIFGNQLVEGVYEMGSIVKPLTMAAGLDAGAVRPETTYNDKGSMTLNNSTFYNYDKKARGVVDMQTVLNNSLNTGVAFVVGKMGNDKFGDYFKKMFEGETGIDLPNEGLPLLKNLNSPRDIEYATASFGQGIAMTPIAITRALAALGNGGLLVTPHLVKEIEYDSGLSKTVDYPEPVRVFKQESSEDISRMLVKVVDEALQGGNVALPNHSIAAKTGTAQIAEPGKGYFENKYLHSFFGYFPAYDPEFIVFIYTVEPQNVSYASETLTNPFMKIAKYLINYYEIPPDREEIPDR